MPTGSSLTSDDEFDFIDAVSLPNNWLRQQVATLPSAYPAVPLWAPEASLPTGESSLDVSEQGGGFEVTVPPISSKSLLLIVPELRGVGVPNPSGCQGAGRRFGSAGVRHSSGSLRDVSGPPRLPLVG
jgi:hypothetical protein